MQINHNVASLKAINNSNKTYNQNMKSMEKLSSGMRIKFMEGACA